MYCSKLSRFVRKSVTGNALTSYLVWKTMSCDENLFKHNKQTDKQFRKENKNSLFPFLFRGSKLYSRRLNQWWKTFPSSVVEAETSRCFMRRNLRVQPVWFCDGYLWIVKPPLLHDAQLWILFSFKYRSMALCMILKDSSSLVSLFLFVPSA